MSPSGETATEVGRVSPAITVVRVPSGAIFVSRPGSAKNTGPVDASLEDNSASRVRFRPPLQRTFGVPPCGFFLRPTGVDSTYSRPVLAARGNLGVTGSSVKGSGRVIAGNCGIFPGTHTPSRRPPRQPRNWMSMTRKNA